MTGKELLALFAPRAIKVGPVLFFDERAALALIEVAQRNDVAIADIDQCRPAESTTYSTLAGHASAVVKDRLDSWRQAREFIAYFSGKGVLFEVVLEAHNAIDRVRAPDNAVTFGFWRPGFLSVFLSLMMMFALAAWLVVLAGF